MNRYIRKNRWDLFKILVHTELVQRYQGSMLGFLWVFLKPLFLFIVLLFVFQVFAGSAEIKNYPLYLLLGLLTYNFFSEGTTFGMDSILSKAHIIKKVLFDRKLILLASVAHAGLNYFFSILIFVLFSIYYGNVPSLIETFIYFYQFFLLTVLIIGLSSFLSIVVVWFRDLNSIWEVILSIAFYFTPIFYPLSIIPERWQKIFMLNPLAVIITNMRMIIINHDLNMLLPTWHILFGIVLLMFVGYVFFTYYSRSIAEQI